MKLADQQLPLDGLVDANHPAPTVEAAADAATDARQDRAPRTTRRTRRLVPTPQAIGLTATDAIDTLRAHGLNPAVEHEQTPDGDQHGLVLAQDPMAGDALARGATVALWIGAPQTVPDAPPDDGTPDCPDPTADPYDVRDTLVAAPDERIDADAAPDDPWFAAPAADPHVWTPASPDTHPVPTDSVEVDAQTPTVVVERDASRGRQLRWALAALVAGLLAATLIPALTGHHRATPPDAAPPTAALPRASATSRSQPDTTNQRKPTTTISARASGASTRRTRSAVRRRSRPAPAGKPRGRRHAPPQTARSSAPKRRRLKAETGRPAAPVVRQQAQRTPAPPATAASPPRASEPAAPAAPARTASRPTAPAPSRSSGETAVEREFGTP